MNENTDESKFKKAYRDKVNFKTFSETDSDKYVNSRFSLLRELATEAAPKVNDIKTAASVRELLSVKPQEAEKPSKVNLSSVALQTNRTSSLKSFLVENTESSYQNKVSPLTDDPAPVKKTAPKKEALIADEEVKVPPKKEGTPSVTDSIPDVSSQSRPFAGLFRSSVTSEFKGRKNDSLQDLYKRLLNS